MAETTEAKSLKAEHAEATRAALIASARALFAERGYAAVSIEEIVRSARVTRGALYHHFADKRDLFRAVHEELEAELVDAIAKQLADSGTADPLEGLRTGVRSYLDACEDPSFARITLIDAPAVLGWVEWRRIDEEHALKLIVLGLEGAMEAGAMRRQPVLPLAHVMLGTMGEAGLRIANGEGTREEIEGALMTLLDGLRT